MSISPRERTGGSYYPRAPSPTPSPHHGSERRRHGRRSPPATVSPPGAGGSGAISEPVLPAIRESINAPEKVVGFRISGEENHTCTQEVGSISECHLSGQGISGFPTDTVGLVGAYPERTKVVGSLQTDHLASGSTGVPGNGTQMAARRSQAVNANHLLNFQYDPISRPQPRGPRPYPPRRQRKIKPYNKDLFLQANYKFVVLDTGNYEVESMDPDKMLQWEDIICVRITGKILELETVTQSEAIRKRYRFLSHFSLTTTFQFCEIDLSDIVPPSSLAPFLDEIKKREKQRKRTAKKEESERVKAEVAAAVQASAMRFEFANFSQSHNDVMFSLDDFEGPSATPALSFASIITSSRAATAADNNSEMQKQNGVGKKGKKPTRVLLSTGGGRRY
nr:unnamed protein product [Digitaria exilis]